MKREIEHLREAMSTHGITYYMVTTADAHNSEYVGDHDKLREYLSGFTGSNGNLLVGMNEAKIWTDGRYFVQAANELKGSDIELMKMGEPEVPTLTEYLSKTLKSGDTLGFDGTTFTYDTINTILNKMSETEINLSYDKELGDCVWTDRPARNHEPIIVHELKYAGESTSSKLSKVRDAYHEKKCTGHFLSKLDDIMWLLNIRGGDVECNPVALSYVYVDDSNVYAFLQEKSLSKEVEEYLSSENVTIKPYEDTAEFLKNLKAEGSVMLDKKSVSFLLVKVIEENNEIVDCSNPTNLLKAVKNDTEIENMKKYFLADSVAMTRYIYYLKQCKDRGGKDEDGNMLTELKAQEVCDSLRSEAEDFRGLSFPTICGYGANAAMMHYEATPDNYAVVEPKGFILTDCGGQYPGATTDVTRTISLGPLTDDERRYYTLTLKGMLNLMNATFLEGCTGRNVDILARLPLWNIGVDYKCGTGHGVGYYLNVHEGPQGIRWQYRQDLKEEKLLPGMLVTDEPGVYKENLLGIRIENTLLTVSKETNSDGHFLCFEPLTYVPLDEEAIDRDLLSPEDIRQLEEYKKAVVDKVSPFLPEDERKWLENI